MALLLLAGAIICEVVATLSLRASDGFAKLWWLIPVAVGYALSFTCLSLALKRGLSIGVAYAIWAGVGVALVAIFGKVIFGDPLTWLMGAGMALIIGGVVLIEVAAAH